MSTQSEQTLENNLIDQLVTLGWGYECKQSSYFIFCGFACVHSLSYIHRHIGNTCRWIPKTSTYLRETHLANQIRL